MASRYAFAHRLASTPLGGIRMLTLAEIESTMQIEYELRLETLGEERLRELIDDRRALRRHAPHHLSDAQLSVIAQRTLAEMVARNAPAAQTAMPAAPRWGWPQLFTWFWIPPR